MITNNGDMAIMLNSIDIALKRISLSEKEEEDKIKNVFILFHDLWYKFGWSVEEKSFKNNKYMLLVTYNNIYYTEKLDIKLYNYPQYLHGIKKYIYNKNKKYIAELRHDDSIFSSRNQKYYSIGNEVYLNFFYSNLNNIVESITAEMLMETEKIADIFESRHEMGIRIHN